MNPVLLHEDIRSHLGIPFSLKVPIVYTCIMWSWKFVLGIVFVFFLIFFSTFHSTGSSSFLLSCN